MKYYICLFFTLIISSCRKHEETIKIAPLERNIPDSVESLVIDNNIPCFTLLASEPTIIHVPSNADSRHIDEFIQDYKYIPLETTKESLIGNISKLVSDSSFIFVFDKQNSTVFRFSDQGNFLGCIGKKGRGPKEYLRLSDMSIDKKRKEICLLSANSRKMIFYNYSGKVLREEFLYYYFHHVEFSSDQMILNTSFAYNDRIPLIDLHRLVIANRNQRPLYKGFAYSEKNRKDFHWEVQRPLSEFGSQIFFNHILSDTIWQIKDSILEAKYIIDIPNQKEIFKFSDYMNLSDTDYSEQIKGKRFFCGMYLIAKDFVYLGIVNEVGFIEPLIYSCSSGNIFYGNFAPQLVKMNLFRELLGNSFDFVMNDSSFVKIIQPFSAMQTIETIKKEKGFSKFSLQEQELVDKMKEEDNPVLMIVNLKNF